MGQADVIDINRDGNKWHADLQQKHFGPGDNYFAYCYSKIFKIVFFVLEFSDDGIKNVENIKNMKKVM